jgi:hypothetical protein
MTSHELARLLLDQPDAPVAVGSMPGQGCEFHCGGDVAVVAVNRYTDGPEVEIQWG